MQVSLDTRADLLRACSDAIEGLGRLSDALVETGAHSIGLCVYDLITMRLDAAYSMMRHIERALRCRELMEV